MAVTTPTRSVLEDPAVDRIVAFLDEHAVQGPARKQTWERLAPGWICGEVLKFRSGADIYNLGLKYPGNVEAAYKVRYDALTLDLRPKYWVMTRAERDHLMWEARANGWLPPKVSAVEPGTLFGMEIRTV